jgi:hypothetical protein
MSQKIRATFVSGQSVNAGQISDVLMIPTGVTSALLNIVGDIDGSNTVKTQKSTNNGYSWADQTTYSSQQINVAVTVVAGEQWRAVCNSVQPNKLIALSLSVES